MKPRQEEIFDQLEELCRINEFANFDISVPANIEGGAGNLCFESKTYSLDELNLSLEDIEWLERLDMLSIVRKHRFKELSQNEISRTTYSLYVPTEITEVHTTPNFIGAVNYIALIGGILITALGAYMYIQNINLVGYDTYYGGGYGEETLTPQSALLIGVILILAGIIGFYLKSKRHRQ